MTPRTSVILTTPLLLALAGSMIGITSHRPDLEAASAALNDFALNESALHSDLLSLRAGLLRNYDPVNQATSLIDAALARMRTAAMNNPTPLASLTARQASLDETFKSDNALLQNALAYFQVFSRRLQAPTAPPSLTQAVNNLSAAMLQLTLDTSPDAVQEVSHQLGLFAAQPVPADLADPAAALLAYGRLLRNLLPATDTVLKDILRLPVAEQQMQASSSIALAQQARATRAARFRILLYATSLLLLVQVINLGTHLHRRRLAARRRVTFERAVASLSVRFISSTGSELADLVVLALAELADLEAADRAYFLVLGDSAQTFIWAKPDVPYQADWPHDAARLAADLSPSEHGVTHIGDRHTLPDGPMKKALGSAGVESWTAIATQDGDRISCLLGLDRLRPRQDGNPPELTLLRMAFDAIANAVRRELLTRDRARLEQSVQRARQVETVAALTGGVAHNFNNIVGTILGYTEMMEDSAPADPKLAQQISGIRQAGERARTLIEQILNYGRKRAIRRDCIDMASLLAETVDQLTRTLPAEIRIAADGPSKGRCLVTGEPAQLQQVIINLCNNAAQAIDFHGDVTLTLDLPALPQERRFSHGRLAAGSYVQLTVSDLGRGMASETMARIFEPFFTTRSDGNGFGLATARDIVQEHGGTMHVESTPGEGSRFEVWLLRAADLVAVPSNAQLFGNGETVLLLAGDLYRQLHDEEVVAALGYEPVGFYDVDHMRTAMQAAPDRFDLAVIDIRDPSAQVEAVASLTRVRPAMPVIVISATSDKLDPDGLTALRHCHLVPLPLTSDKLASAFKSVTATNRTASQPAI
ncbi:two-component system VirA-like sensor kinase [Rhodopila sp.]|uniref:two-component system VirA-like sensor kinase n=1 Tax=Rhodopila sp. TaxID=2480087 RepID=UPI003D09AE66